MESFTAFFKSILNEMGLDLNKELNVQEVRNLIKAINDYFYTNYEGIGTTYILDDYFEYFSEFHKFWEKYHELILNVEIIDSQCEKVADVLHDIYLKTDGRAFFQLYDTGKLSPEEICKIRFLTANQDFRGSRNFNELMKIYNDDPGIFDIEYINKEPAVFLKNIGITELSQSDKRIKFAQTVTRILLDLNIEPFLLIEHFNRDILALKNFLIKERGAGYGNKKADIFLRDMVVLKVWDDIKNFDYLDVASDVNTIKVALRTGIMKTSIPLLSSFLDIFCYQYGYIDNMNARAWRRVWELWKLKYPDECIDSPCLIDYFVYDVVGRQFCRESLVVFECETGRHKFKWHSTRNKTCQECRKRGERHMAHIVNKLLPCTDDDGYIAIQKTDFVSSADSLLPNLRECPFSVVCNPKSTDFKKLNPPKSISILGQTGWESAKVRREEGGGGLMS